jgi:hypothetical protein
MRAGMESRPDRPAVSTEAPNEIRYCHSAAPSLMSAVALPGAVVARTGGRIDTVALLAAVWAAAQACFIRAGIANEVAENAASE